MGSVEDCNDVAGVLIVRSEGAGSETLISLESEHSYFFPTYCDLTRI